MLFVRLGSLTDMDVPLRVLLILAGLTGIHSIRVSEVSVKAGGSISIPCLYSSQYTNHVKYLCKGYYWNSCTYEVKTNQKNSATFSISDDKNQKIFTVNGLTNDDSYYWCAVEINRGGDDGYRFHLSVTTGTRSLYVDNQEKTAFLGGAITIKCHHQRNPGEMRWCRMGSSCVTQRSGSIDGTEVTINTNVPNVFSVTMRGLKTESSGWYLCVSGNLQFPVRLTVTEQPTTTPLQKTTRTENLSTFLPGTTPTTVQKGQNRNASFGLTETLILTSVLIFTLMVALCFCLMLKRHKQNKSASSAMKEAEEEVTYSVVKPRRKPSSQVEADEENVTYSTLALD